MTRPAGVEAVIFDWGGTLTPWHPIDLSEQWRAYAESYDPSNAKELAAALAASEEQTWRAGREHHASGTLDDIVSRAGVDPASERHRQALARYHAFWEPHTYLDPDAIPTIDGLHERGIKVGVLSNTVWTREFHEQVFRRDGILDRLDGAVYSSEIEWTKPHPDAYRAAMAAVGATDPSRCVFVGDRPFEDVYGPQQLGMRAVLIPHSEIPEHQLGHTQGEPDAVAHRLTDLLEIVDAWR